MMSFMMSLQPFLFRRDRERFFFLDFVIDINLENFNAILIIIGFDFIYFFVIISSSKIIALFYLFKKI